MLKVTQLKLPVEHNEKDIKNKIVKDLRLNSVFPGNIPNFTYKVVRRSIDARKKPEIYYVYSITLDFKNAQLENQVLKRCKNSNVAAYEKNEYTIKSKGTLKLDNRPVIVGTGPAGLFSAYLLAREGYKPLLIERGEEVDKRVEKVADFWANGSIDKNSNVQFGEGGAGTFSDGKLNTVVKDPSGRNQFVLDLFVEFGARKEVAYDAKPHVGTDVLIDVVKNIRKYIIDHGGLFINSCLLTDLVIVNNEVKSIVVDNFSGSEYNVDGKVLKPGLNTIEANAVILAIGHSARDTFSMLYNKGIPMTQKNFAVGLRIQHRQKLIDDIQYGLNHSKYLPAADYKLTNKASNGKNVYSFCMCPGGYVVNASSFEGKLCVNGMSYSGRDAENANSALIVNVDETDFGSDDVLAGMYFQEKLESKAYELGKGTIPVQYFGGFRTNDSSYALKGVNPVVKGDFTFTNLRELLPENLNEALIESIDKFGYTMKGFNDDGALLLGVESRTSSPVRIERNEYYESSIKGLYPCGEGAGYAGGITSAAIDGLKVAEAIISKYSAFV